MRSGLFVATTAAAALAAGSAFAQCDQRLQNMQAEFGDFLVSGSLGYAESRPVLRDLRDAAIRLQQQGLEQACEDVVNAMQTTIAAYQDFERQGGTVGTGTTTGAMPGAVGRPLVTPGEFTPEQIQARSVPLAQSDIAMNTDELQNRDVYSFNGEDIGDFEGLLISGGEPTHIIVSHGGFFNLGSNDVAIPLGMVSWDPEWQTFVGPFTEDQIESAPEYERSVNWDVTGNDEYWGQFRG